MFVVMLSLLQLPSLFSEMTALEENLLFLVSDVEADEKDGGDLTWINDVGLMQSNLMMDLLMMLMLLLL
jgi:hypothetical protein